MRVAFRVDASDAIGSGHVMRCLTLADRLAADGHECAFVMRAHPGHMAAEVERRGHGMILLDPDPAGPQGGDLAHSAWLGTTQDADAAATTAALGEPVDWLVVDHYALDARWERAMRPLAAKLLVIDDLADRAHESDLLLDQNLQERDGRYDGHLAAGTTVLLGPHFALLRPEFAALRAQAGEARTLGPGARLLVYFGGIDAAGATLVALGGIAAAGLADVAVDIVAGARNPHLPAIRQQVETLPRATLHEGAVDLGALMAQASVALGAAGASAWERCCLNLPTILLTIAANQRPGAAALARLPAALWLGDAEEVTPQAIADALRTLFVAPDLHAALAANGAALVDGRGAARVAARMIPPRVTLRPALPEDCEAVWRWRNHPDTRRHFHDTREVPLDAHRSWFAAALADPERRLWIGERDGDPVGVIRFDRAGDTALVSVYLVPGLGGLGFGSALIAAGCAAIAHEWPGLAAVDAEVLPANRASAESFAKAGFAPHYARLRLPLANGTPE